VILLANVWAINVLGVPLAFIVLAILATYILWPIVPWTGRQVREYLEFRREEQERLSGQ
jgi:predicted PurR-regulated permease PerM